MSNLLDSNTSSECLDDRDRVYALIGIIPPDTRPDILPDYTIGVKDVYKQLVSSLGKYKDPDILRFCAISETPSWVRVLHNLRDNTVHWLAVHSWASGDLQGTITELESGKA
jgi:hypothetical protein